MNYNTENFCDALFDTDGKRVTFVSSLFLPFGRGPKPNEDTIFDYIQYAITDFLLHLTGTIFFPFICGAAVTLSLLTEANKALGFFPTALFCSVICIALGAIAFAISLAIFTIASATRTIGTIFPSIVEKLERYSTEESNKVNAPV